MAIGDNVRFVPVDFEHQVLRDELAGAGFDLGAPGFFLWLGVVPYLTDAAVFGTLGTIAAIGGSETVFDYGNPLEQLSDEMAITARARAKKAAEIGEPFLSYFDSVELHRRLTQIGASAIDDFGPERLADSMGGRRRTMPAAMSSM